jgi:hypothetical protein
MTSRPNNDLYSIIVLLGITIFNVGIIVGILLTIVPFIPTAKIIALATIEFLFLFGVYHYAMRRKSSDTYVSKNRQS